MTNNDVAIRAKVQDHDANAVTVVRGSVLPARWVPAWVWPRLLLGGFVFFLAVELEKLIIRTRRSAVHSAPIRRNLSAV